MRKLIKNKQAYTKVVGGLIALLVTIGVGALVFWEITDNFDGTSADANDSLNETQDMASTVFDLLPIIALVVVATIIIGIVVGMGGRSGGF
jgi:flagellar biogenesis protein FliO